MLTPYTEPPQKILIIGDSLTYGIHVSHESKMYRNVIADELGVDLVWCFARQWKDVDQCWFDNEGNYKYVILEVGLNDVAGSSDVKEWGDRYNDVVSLLKLSNGDVYVTSMFHAVTHKTPYFGQFYTRYEALNEQIEMSDGIFVDVWKETKLCIECISTIDDVSIFEPYHGDDFHPNDIGMQLIADTILNVINKEYKLYLPIHGLMGA